MGEFRMPSLGADMDVGTIIEWLVKPGDAVRRGQIVAVVDTAKAAIEIEAFEEGVVTEILVGTGVKVPVGTPLAMIGTSEDRGAPAGPAAPAAPGFDAATSDSVVVVVDSVDSTDGIDYHKPGLAAPGAPPPHPRATPPVRHLAHQLGVDLDAIPGTGPDGHITHDDVLRAAPVATGPSGTPKRDAGALAASTAPTPSHARLVDGAHPVPRCPDSRAFTHLESGRDRRWSARWRTTRWGRGCRGGDRWRSRGAAAGDSAGAADRCRAWDRPGRRRDLRSCRGSDGRRRGARCRRSAATGGPGSWPGQGSSLPDRR